MEYTISKLARLAGVSTRTLRYYDEIGLLKPARVSSNGYRIYGQFEVDRLHHILFFRELDVDLETITAIMNDPNYDKQEALQQHLRQLVQRRSRLDQLIETVKRTIAHEKGEYSVSNEDKFKAFKEQWVRDNENKYGEEIRRKYGESTVQASNERFRGMSEEDFKAMQAAEKDIFNYLAQGLAIGDPSSEPAQAAAAKHKEWLLYSWPQYNKEAHAGLVDMYVADERFKAYYDKTGEGAAEFLREAVLLYLSK